MAERWFQAGEEIPYSGVYLVVHDGHRPDHEATLLAGEQFPPCTTCMRSVKYRLSSQAARITEDADFAGV